MKAAIWRAWPGFHDFVHDGHHFGFFQILRLTTFEMLSLIMRHAPFLAG
jgi:hypothetical protein